MKILIVDDSPTQLLALRHILTNDGHEIATATNGQEALQLQSQIGARLIILDIRMPGMDGLEACRQLRKNQKEEAPTIILFTADLSLAKMIEGYRSGANYYLQKEEDDDINRLRRIIQNLIHQEERENLKANKGINL